MNFIYNDLSIQIIRKKELSYLKEEKKELRSFYNEEGKNAKIYEKKIIKEEKKKDIKEINEKIKNIGKMSNVEYFEYLKEKKEKEENEENEEKNEKNETNKEESSIDDKINKILKLGKYSKRKIIIDRLKFRKKMRIKRINSQ